jgi:hypothetical protein
VQPGVTLQKASGVVTLSTPGQVYENKELTGSIIVTAKNVTIRNVRLINTDPYYGIAVKSGGSWEASDANLLVDHVEINIGRLGDPGGGDYKGIAFNGYTLRHAFVHNGSDCTAMGQNVTIEDSFCVDGPDTNSDGVPDNTSFCGGSQHFDGFQSDGGNNITIRHNTLRNPCGQTSNILMSSNTSPISNVVIDNNLFGGGGYSLYCAGDSRGDRVTNITATNNRFAKTYFPKGGYWGPTAYCEEADKFSGNVWDDTSSSLGA